MAPRNRRMMPPKGAIKKGTFGRLIRFVAKDYGGRLIIVIACMLFSAFASVVVSIFMRNLIDNCIMPGIELGLDAVWGDLMSIITTLAIVYLFGITAAFTYTRIMAVVTQGVLMNFRNAMFDKMETLPIRYFDTNAHGDIMSTYTNDTDAVRQLIGQSIPSLIQSGVTVIGSVCVMLSYSIWLTLVVFAVIFLMFRITKVVGGLSSKYMMAQQRALAAEEGFVEEMITGQKVVKVFNHETQSKIDFDGYNEQLFGDSEKAHIYGNILMPILHNIGNLLYVLIAVIGGTLVYFDAPNFCLRGIEPITIGIIISFLGMSRQLSHILGQASMQVSMIAMGLAGVSRVFELMDRTPEFDEGVVTLVNAEKDEDGTLREADHHTGLWAWKQPDGEDGCIYTELRGDVRMQNVDFGYTEDKPVLHDVSLFAKPGQKIAFVGATGAGKTTITNLINRFYDINDGVITYDGIDIKRIKKSDLRRSLGIVLQDVNLFTGTVMENIRYGRLDATDEECMEAARLANAHDFITRLPEGYNTMLTNNGASLSQGQRQLLSIARAAVANPPAMILDEATSSIDTRTEALVQEGMDNLMKGRTVFVIAHRLSTVRNSKAIMVLDHGRIIERGDHDQLMAEKGVYYQLYTGAFELE